MTFETDDPREWSQRPRYSRLEGEQRLGWGATMLNVKMTGVARAEQDATGAITLTYEDGTTETRSEANAPDLLDFPNYFAVVQWVQDARGRD